MYEVEHIVPLPLNIELVYKKNLSLCYKVRYSKELLIILILFIRLNA